MSTALSHLAYVPLNLLSGSNADGDTTDDYARMLEEQFGPPNASRDLLDDILSDVETCLLVDEIKDD